jgi:hypothetical protein
MPNWVYNTVEVTGENQRLDKFMVKAGMPYDTKGTEFEDGEFIMKDVVRDSAMSFWNFIKPEASVLEEYHGQAPRYHSLEDSMKHGSDHWYDWNSRNWGTKWDAVDASVQESEGALTYEFRTAWGQPEEVFEVMVMEFPELIFHIRSVEEQGWGVEYEGASGVLTELRKWDSPRTHEESMEYMGMCHCQESGNEDYNYSDCTSQNTEGK